MSKESDLIKVEMDNGKFIRLAFTAHEMTKSYGGMYIKAGGSFWYGFTPQGVKLEKPYAVLTPDHFKIWEEIKGGENGLG